MLERSTSWSLNVMLMCEWKVRMREGGSSWKSVIEGVLKAGQSLVWGQRIVWTNIVMKCVHLFNQYVYIECLLFYLHYTDKKWAKASTAPTLMILRERMSIKSLCCCRGTVQHGKAMERFPILGKPTAGGLNPWRSSGKDFLQGVLHGVSPARWMGYIVAEDRKHNMGKGSSYAELYRQTESSSVGQQWKARADSREKFKATKTLPLVPVLH